MVDFLSSVKTLTGSSLKPANLKPLEEDVVLVKLKEPT